MLLYKNFIINNREQTVFEPESEKIDVLDYLLRGLSSSREKTALATERPDMFLSL